MRNRVRKRPGGAPDQQGGGQQGRLAQPEGGEGERFLGVGGEVVSARLVEPQAETRRHL